MVFKDWIYSSPRLQGGEKLYKFKYISFVKGGETFFYDSSTTPLSLFLSLSLSREFTSDSLGGPTLYEAFIVSLFRSA